MLYRENPKNKEQISQLAYGCMRFPRKGMGIDITRSKQLVQKAIDRGINYFDTAYIYPGSEAALGQILSKGQLREKVKIATKMPLFLIKSAKDFDKYFAEQLKRLKTDYIDYYLLHMLTDFESFERLKQLGILEWIQKQKTNGRIKNIGFSYHGRQDAFIKLIDDYDWDSCMIQYNYLDEEYQAGMKGLLYAHKKGIPVFIMEPLRGGKLASHLPAEAAKAFQSVNKERTPADWGLRWVWNHPEVISVLSGMSTDDQLEENLNSANKMKPNSLTKAELNAYGKVVSVMKKSIKVNCTGCGYCTPCPAGVDIPHVFTRYNDSFIASKSNIRMNYMLAAGVIPKTPTYASLCKKCGKCEKHCPQNIDIMNKLSEAAKYLEPFWIKPLAKIAKRVTKGKKEK